MDKPIPAFYACYLLRSTVRHQSLYVGSTPNPVRRLRQHNGISKGGAVRTSRDSLRPWEMTCLVTGFPSKIAALQLEWAWQNSHLTRHITAEDRLTQTQARNHYSAKSGKIRKRPGRPRLSLTDRIANLHLLLRASSFERWPLKVTFYDQDVYRVWEKWTRQHVGRLRFGITVSLDEDAKPKTDHHGESSAPKGINVLDVTYAGTKPHLEKSKKRIDDADWLHCSICASGLPANGAATLFCPTEGCKSLWHIECLSEAFIKDEGDEELIVPTSGQCPSCKSELQWQDLVKELSLRMRGEKEVKALFKARRRRRKGDAAEMTADSASDGSNDDAEMDGPYSEDEADDVWHELPDSDDELEKPTTAARSDPSPAPKRSKFTTAKAIQPPYSEPVIEESDWDDAEVIS